MSQTFGFNMVTGEFAWAVHNGNEVICFIPQYGSWYETKHAVDEKVDYLVSVQKCLEDNSIQVIGQGTRMLLAPGQYHPRIWRGAYRSVFNGCDRLDPLDVYAETYTRSIVAAESLFSEVKELFRVVEPEIQNFNSYGHRIRELLILLCTEIEACWAGVLKANGMETKAKGRFTTKNYINVCDPLRLTEWKVRLKDYRLIDFQPFRYWNFLLPTFSLPWYDAYNKVKHDREDNFSFGTLDSVLHAAAALHIMQVAQFGRGVFDMLHGNRFSIFEIVESPVFGLCEVYLPDPIDTGRFHTEVMFARETPSERSIKNLVGISSARVIR